jgi:integrative and conjugative element protein (TIGR02256 family)
MDWATAAKCGIETRTGRGTEILRLEPQALATIERFRQTGNLAPEAGGMLLATIEPDLVRVVQATEPAATDRRSRFAFIPTLGHQQRIIDKQFRSGLHFIGEWHTHPELRPIPSSVDLRSMADCFRESRHQLASLVMLILGTETAFEGLWVSLHTSTGYKRLLLSDSSWCDQ